jgi:purine-nucleoside phosphorylase
MLGTNASTQERSYINLRPPQSPLRVINDPLGMEQSTYRKLYSDFMRATAHDLQSWIEISSIFHGIELPRSSVILGSGLGALTSQLEIVARRPFIDCGLAKPTADGHSGEFLLAAIAGKGVLLQSGRMHLYENWSPAVVALPVRAQAIAGITNFIITNAAGSLCPDVEVGDLVVLSGNSGAQAYSPSNSLFDAKNEDVGPFGEKFYPVNDCYSQDLRSEFFYLACQHEIRVHTGVYQFMPGPRYEEPNEIARFVRERQQALASGTPENALIAVGMSTAPEVYALAQLRTHPSFSNIQVLGISNITNKAAGIGGSTPTSEEVLAAGPIGGSKIAKILRDLLPNIQNPNIKFPR